MASISKALIHKLEREVGTNPIQPGEFRRIEGMGSHYLSLESSRDGQAWFFKVPLSGVEYFVFFGRPDSVDENGKP